LTVPLATEEAGSLPESGAMQRKLDQILKETDLPTKPDFVPGQIHSLVNKDPWSFS
jgi:hypothetical protein